MGIKIIMGIIMVGVILSLGLGVFIVSKVNNQTKTINDYLDQQAEKEADALIKENSYIEDGFVVAGLYEIRSTTKISDAYKSKDDSKLNDKEKETLTLATKVLDKVVKKDMTLYEKEKAVYEWMCKNISHQGDGTVTLPSKNAVNAFTPNGVLKGKQAVCVGYATTFRLFVNMLGIECHIVHTESHSWDLIKLDDGKWYHVDIYSDATGNQTNYQYFNCSDAVMTGMSSTWDTTSLPKAKGVKYSYPVQNKKIIDNVYALPTEILQAMKKGKTYLFVEMKKKVTEKDLPIVNYIVSGINERLATNMPQYAGYTLSASWYLDENSDYILGIYITNYGVTDSVDKDSAEGKKISQIVSDIFGEGSAYGETTYSEYEK